MAVDIDVAAHARIDDEADEARISTKMVHMSAWAAPDNVNGDAPHWIYGSPRHQSTPALLRQICVLRVIHHPWISMTG